MTTTTTIKEATILLLGSPQTGKSTFLSRLPQIQPQFQSHSFSSITPLNSPIQSHQPPSWPQTFNVTLYSRPYKIHIYPSLSPLFTDPFPPYPSLAIITYDISSRATLLAAAHYWRPQFAAHYPDIQHDTPVMLLGLKRDLRTEERERDEGGEGEGEGRYRCVMPEEGLRVAQEMRADRYAECSAHTGELYWEVVEDLTRTAALAVTREGGGLSGGDSCVLM